MRWSTAAIAGLICLAPASAALAAAAAPTGFRLKANDTLVHKASGTEFPPHLAGFDRTFEKPLDLAGHDVVISYRQTIAGHPVVARIAMVHIVAMTPMEHYLALKSLVGTYFQDLLFTDIAAQGEGPFTPPGMPVDSGYQGRFRARQAGTPYELSLSTVKLGKWDARLTAAYPEAASAEAREHILTLVAGLQRTGPGFR